MAILANPVQTYYVPLPEDDLFETFDTINSRANGRINNVISVAIAADGTLIYYDHWEDGYDPTSNDTDNKQASTEIWGDGDLTNGIAPGDPDGDDILKGGQAIILENAIPRANNYRNPNTILFDGADRIQSSLPIAVTRFAFPRFPGSLAAGAVEVFDTNSWGDSFIALVGEDTANYSGTNPFEYSVFYVMAGEDETELFLNGTSIGTIDTGDNFVVEDLSEGDVLTSSNPVQVDLITGDVGDTYELRWYSQIDSDQWTNEYITPVAEETGSTGYWFYNPNNSQITISYEGADAENGNFNVEANSSAFIEIDWNGDINLSGDQYSGLRFFTEANNNGGSTPIFNGLAQIDADGNGKVFDWGFPLIPRDQITAQALVGLGRGATDDGFPLNNQGEQTRSVVWVTPVEDSVIFIDFDGDGTFDNAVEVAALDSLRIVDDTDSFSGAENDQDLTGAIIVSNTSEDINGQPDGDLVRMALVWGQDPSRSSSSESEALDLGTVVVPLAVPFVNKEVLGITNPDGSSDSDGIVDQAVDVINYQITVGNVGFQDLTNGILSDPLLEGANGILTGPVESINDDGILERAETWIYTGSYTVQQSDIDSNGTLEPDNIAAGLIDNTATFYTEETDPMDDNEQVPITQSTPINPSIEIIKTAGDVADGETLVAEAGNVTFSYEVTNTGDTYLAPIQVIDDNGTPENTEDDIAVGFSFQPLAPDESVTFTAEIAVESDRTNIATVLANPSDIQGQDLPGIDDVADSDDAVVTIVEPVNPSIEIIKTAGDAADGEIFVTEAGNVTFTYEVTNTGDTFLSPIQVVDDNGTPGNAEDDILVDFITRPLAPDESVTLVADIAVNSDRTNIATVLANPSDIQGQDLPGVDDVGDSDDAVVTIVEPVSPSIEIIKTAGDAPDGETLVTEAGNVTFTYEVTNTGDTFLTPIQVVDDNGTPENAEDDILVDFITRPLAPDESVTLVADIAVNSDRTNIATVLANPSDIQGQDLPGVDDVGDSDDAVVTIIEPVSPSIEIIKTAGDAADGETLVTEAGNVTFSYKVTNTGDTFLSPIQVVDDNGTPENTEDDILVGFMTRPLAPNESRTLMSDIAVPSDRTNIATATANPSDSQGQDLPGVDDITDSDDAVVNVVNPEIEIVNVTNGDDGLNIPVGDAITWTYTVTNTGNIEIGNLVLTDDQLGVISGPDSGDVNDDGILQTTETWVYTATGTAIAGQYDNVGTVVGSTILGVVDDNDPSSYFGTDPGIELVKLLLSNGDEDGSATVSLGDTLTYEFTVSNIGNVTLGDTLTYEFTVSNIVDII